MSRYLWHWFVTLTFRTGRCDPFELVKIFRLWLTRVLADEAVSRGLGEIVIKPARRQGDPPRRKQRGRYFNGVKRRDDAWLPVWVLGVEPHQSGDLHMHAVVKLPDALPDVNRKRAWHTWTDDRPLGFGNGFARIEPPKSFEDVLGYCCKYVSKDASRGGWLELSHSFNAPTAMPLAGQAA